MIGCHQFQCSLEAVMLVLAVLKVLESDWCHGVLAARPFGASAYQQSSLVGQSCMVAWGAEHV